MCRFLCIILFEVSLSKYSEAVVSISQLSNHSLMLCETAKLLASDKNKLYHCNLT